MAKRWSIPFESIRGRRYEVEVFDPDFSGEAVELTAAPSPFTTQEDDDEDIFKPIRQQTGYLRIVDSGNIMRELMPWNNLHRFVRLMEGETVRWQGFMQAQAFEQEWKNVGKVLEFPVKSLLAAAQDVRLTPEQLVKVTFAELLQMFAAELSRHAAELSCSFRINTTRAGDYTTWTERINLYTFSSKETVCIENDRQEIENACSYAEALEEVLSLHGMTMREDGTTITIATLNEKNNGIAESPTTELHWAGEDHRMGFTPGRRSVSVKLSFNPDNLTVGLPPTNETDDELHVIELQQEYPLATYENTHGQFLSSTTRVQFVQQLGSNEYREFRRKVFHYGESQSYWSDEGASSENKLKAHSFPVWPGYFPSWNNQSGAYTGALHCRWTQGSANTVPSLRSGVYIGTTYAFRSQTKTDNMHVAYGLTSAEKFDVNSGHLCLDMEILSFWTRWEQQRRSANSYFNSGTIPDSANSVGRYFYVRIKAGSLYWNEIAKEWTATPSFFKIHCERGSASIKTNKTNEIKQEKSDGFWIPVIGRMNDHVSVEVMDHCSMPTTNTNDNYMDAHGHIITELKLTYYPPSEIIRNSRNHNTYKRTIIDAGFSGDEVIGTSVGTFNNNQPSPSFLRDSNDDFITELEYAYRQGSGGIVRTTERPELRLLSRMADYYGKVRQTLSPIVKDDIADITRKRFRHEGRTYCPMVSHHDWSDEELRLKLIEIYE